MAEQFFLDNQLGIPFLGKTKTISCFQFFVWDWGLNAVRFPNFCITMCIDIAIDWVLDSRYIGELSWL